MKRVKFVLSIGLLSLSLLLITCDTRNNVEPTFKNYFIRYYGEDGNHEAKDFVVTNDGGVIVVGTITTGLDKRVYILKTDLEGNELWSTILDSDYNEIVEDIEFVLEGVDAGKYIILSNVQIDENVFQTRFTILTSSGTIDYVKELQTKVNTQQGISVTSILSGGQGGYFLSGKTTDWADNSANNSLPSPPDKLEDLLLVTLDQNLDTVYFDRIGGSYSGSVIKVIQIGSNQFMYGGHWDGATSGRLPNEPKIEFNLFFRSFNSIPSSATSMYAGTLQLNEKMVSICKSNFGMGLAVCTQSDDNGINRKVFAVSTNSDFTTVLTESVILGDSDEFEAVSVSSGASRFYVLANQINAQGNRDIYLKRVDGILQSDLDLVFGNENNDDRGAAVAELPNGDILILGTMELAGQQDKIALIKVRADGTF